MNEYIPIKSEEFDVTIAIDGNIKFRDKSGMTGFARRHGGWFNGVMVSVAYFFAMTILTIVILLLFPASWSENAKDWTAIGLTVAAFGGVPVILAFWLRRLWLAWGILGLAGTVGVLIGGGSALHALFPLYF